MGLITMADIHDRLAETREMVATQGQKIDDIKAWLCRFREENAAQHAANLEAQKASKRSQAGLYHVLWSGVLGALFSVFGLSVYLIQSEGGPWVTKTTFQTEMQEVRDLIERMDVR